MPKIKTNKTASKRVKITNNKKLIKSQTDVSHLRRKWTANKKHRKNKTQEVTSKGYKKMFKKLLPGRL
jgi:ribosomal protein L35